MNKDKFLVDIQDLINFLTKLLWFYERLRSSASNLLEFKGDDPEIEALYWRAVGKEKAIEKILKYWKSKKEELQKNMLTSKTNSTMVDDSLLEYIHMCMAISDEWRISRGDLVAWKCKDLPNNYKLALVYDVDFAQNADDFTLLNIITLDKEGTYHIVSPYNVVWLPRIDQLLELIKRATPVHVVRIDSLENGKYMITGMISSKTSFFDVDKIEKGLLRLFMRHRYNKEWDSKTHNWIEIRRQNEKTKK